MIFLKIISIMNLPEQAKPNQKGLLSLDSPKRIVKIYSGDD